MLRHIFKLVWKRKLHHALLTLEILLAFVVIFAVAAIAVRNAQVYHQPIGMDYQDVWSVEIQRPDSQAVTADPDAVDLLRRTVGGLPEVESVGFLTFSPFDNSTMRTGFARADRSGQFDASTIQADVGAMRVLRVPIEEGRAFVDSDSATERLAVVNRSMAKRLFGDRSPLGLKICNNDDTVNLLRVVGVVDDFRPQGELESPTPFVIQRFVPGGRGDLRSMLLRLKPGVTRSFQERLEHTLKQVRPGWSFTVAPLTDKRAEHLREGLIPLIVAAVIGVFLLLMVAFGLFGVLWQNVWRRVPEMGLRRALGATEGQIYRQIVAEQMALSTLAVVLALALLVQIPITGAGRDMLNWSVFVGAALVSSLVIYLISLLCALYPGWRASRLHPTEALHYE
ncbi:MAG TPA: FtsX-like permease family protein [Telluria sp.]|nr:FtsX-like permease family protein [Telluria sp.]